MLLIFPVNTLETVVNSVAINSHPRQPQDFCSEAQAGVQQAGRSVWSWAQEVRLGWVQVWQRDISGAGMPSRGHK